MAFFSSVSGIPNEDPKKMVQNLRDPWKNHPKSLENWPFLLRCLGKVWFSRWACARGRYYDKSCFPRRPIGVPFQGMNLLVFRGPHDGPHDAGASENCRFPVRLKPDVRSAARFAMTGRALKCCLVSSSEHSGTNRFSNGHPLINTSHFFEYSYMYKYIYMFFSKGCNHTIRE